MARPLGLSAAHQPPVEAALSAPLFRSVMERMQDDSRWVVLDLGPAQPGTVAAFGHFRCRLEIADLADGIDALNAPLEPDQLGEWIEQRLPARRAEPTDVVLCWDLLNYLERPALKALMGQILLRLRPGSLVHALIAYSTPQMSARPERFVPGEDHALLHQPVTSAQRPAPRYSPDDLARCMPAYSVERAMLLKNGMQEFLFRH
jgi:hypothetical protein